MKRAYTVEEIQNWNSSALIDGKWVPARTINHTCRTLRERLEDAWMVFTGRADLLVWPEDKGGSK